MRRKVRMGMKNEFSTFRVDGKIISSLFKNIKAVKRTGPESAIASLKDENGRETEFECFFCDEGDWEDEDDEV